MLKRFIFISSFATFLGLDAFAQAKPPVPPPAAEEPLPAMSVQPGYKHASEGRRDPFVNPVPKPPPPEPAIPVIRPPGLKGVLLSEAKVSGVVWSRDPEMNRVVISAPGGRTYFAQKGDPLFDAVIKEIHPDGAVFELRIISLVQGAPTPAGRSTTQEVVRKVRPTP